jgi:hypothetical protein
MSKREGKNPYKTVWGDAPTSTEAPKEYMPKKSNEFHHKLGCLMGKKTCKGETIRITEWGRRPNFECGGCCFKTVRPAIKFVLAAEAAGMLEKWRGKGNG